MAENMIAKADCIEENPANELAQKGAGVYTGVAIKDKKDKISLFNSISSAVSIWDELDNNPDLVIDCVNVVAHATSITDMNDSDVELDKVRVIFVGADGRAWSTSSEAVYSAVKQLFAIFGQPSEWEEPLAIKPVVEKSRGGNKYLSIALA